METRISLSESTEKTLTQVRTGLREPTNDTEVGAKGYDSWRLEGTRGMNVT